MTAKLANAIDSAFSYAQDIDRFFSKFERDDIRDTYEVREQPPLGKPGDSCKTNLFFGFFFDGTKNNYRQADAEKNHSNVARLYDCFPGLSVPGVLPPSTDWKRNPDRYTHFFKAYIPGVASPFPQVHDSGEGKQLTMGAAFGALGERRIIWALVQAINNVHRYFLKAPLVTQPELDSLYRLVSLNKIARANMEGQPWAGDDTAVDTNMGARKAFEKLLARLHRAVSQHWPDPNTGKVAKIDPAIVQTIYISTFGFSRGATQARAFVNWLQSLCRLDAQMSGRAGRMTLGGFDVAFDFLGLFDTVASVGLGNTLGNFALAKRMDGHGAWADTEDSLRIPPGVKCLHLVAAHELRRSFPVDSISVRGTPPDGCEEIVIPGVHSDVGCGYCPTEQGRGTDPNGDDMLSRIPLLFMYKAARTNGVPLKLEMADPIAQARFALKPETIAAYNAYIATCKDTQGPIHRVMREQARKQMEWRLARRHVGKSPMHETASFKRASTFDQNDLHSANHEFEDELAEFLSWRKGKGREFKPQAQSAGFDNEHLAEWEEIATWYDGYTPPPDEVLAFFDNYVHDSRAWFKLIPKNPDNEKDLHAKLAEWLAARKQAKEREARAAQSGEPYGYRDGLEDYQRNAADEYEKTGQIPRFLNSGREPSDSSWKSWGLSARAGYLRFRKIYGGWDTVLLSSVPKGPVLATAVNLRDRPRPESPRASTQG